MGGVGNNNHIKYVSKIDSAEPEYFRIDIVHNIIICYDFMRQIIFLRFQTE